MSNKFIHAFNIRVYGLFINKRNEILLADEERYGVRMTKFPGGGLQFGESTIECLKREALEEMGQEIEIIRHFYTTDFFLQSAFNSEHQLISIYYVCKIAEEEKFRLAKTIYDFQEISGEMISFRYKSLKEITEEDLTYRGDKQVIKLLKMEQEQSENNLSEN